LGHGLKKNNDNKKKKEPFDDVEDYDNYEDTEDFGDHQSDLQFTDDEIQQALLLKTPQDQTQRCLKCNARIIGKINTTNGDVAVCRNGCTKQAW
jgi:hypothetical protein